MTDIIISGMGKMGMSVFKETEKDENFSLLGNIKDIDNFESTDKAVIVDFSHREKLKDLLKKAVRLKIPVVSGTTGLTKEDFSLLKDASERIPVFYSPNMSEAVERIRRFLKENSSFFKENCEAEITEIHRKGKKDIPSGTALLLKNELWEDVSITSLRFGDEKGMHSILFLSPDEEIEIRHTALKRSAFSKGALKAAAFIRDKGPGFYTMEDMK